MRVGGVLVQRCGDHPCRNKCPGTDQEDSVLRRAAAQPEVSRTVPPTALAPLASAGVPLDRVTAARMSAAFGRDFSGVRVHTDSRASEGARAVGARAYTVRSDIVFGAGRYAPATLVGLQLLAHELTHVVQQSTAATLAPSAESISVPTDASEREAERISDLVLSGSLVHPEFEGSVDLLQRACLPAAVCAAPIAGSAVQFGTSEQTGEVPARARRAGMSPPRAGVHGHGGHARQLERFLDTQVPGLRANIHGIFVDQDLSPGTGALTMACADFTPQILGATKPCVFVHGSLNQQALDFNTTAKPTVGGRSREDWRVMTTQILVHEIQHVLFGTAPLPLPAGVTTCTRASVDDELSELNAIMSEFPIAFRAVPVGAALGDPARARLNAWFTRAITSSDESVQGILKTLRCKCDCADADRFITQTFNFVSSSWTPGEKAAFNAEFRQPKWGLTWPL